MSKSLTVAINKTKAPHVAVDVRKMTENTPFCVLNLCVLLQIDPVSIVRNLSEAAHLCWEAERAKHPQLVASLRQKWQQLTHDTIKEATSTDLLPSTLRTVEPDYHDRYVAMYVGLARSEIDAAYALPKQSDLEYRTWKVDERKSALDNLFWRVNSADMRIKTPVLMHLAITWSQDFVLAGGEGNPPPKSAT